MSRSAGSQGERVRAEPEDHARGALRGAIDVEAHPDRPPRDVRDHEALADSPADAAGIAEGFVPSPTPWTRVDAAGAATRHAIRAADGEHFARAVQVQEAELLRPALPERRRTEQEEVRRTKLTRLAEAGLEPYPVTSGSKGIHLYTALPPGQTTEQASALANELARAIEADHRDLVVSSMKKSERQGRVLIDWSQNNGSKTTIAPYSLRGRPHPTVAAPRTWEELEEPGLRHLEFSEMLDRIDAIGDPMAALGFHAGGREAVRPVWPCSRVAV